MNAIIYECQPNAKRIKFHLPYKALEWRTKVKKIPSNWYHGNQKLWSVVNTVENMALLKNIFGNSYSIEHLESSKRLPKFELDESGLLLLNQMEEKLILIGYSHHTRKAYKNAMAHFCSFFIAREHKKVSKTEIESYVYHLKSKYKIGSSKQNIVINAIKFYYEKVLGMPREYYDIQRPKKAKELPNVLSKSEILKVINAPKNIKHKCILYTIYSAGLRREEALNLRVEDIHSEEKYIFVKGGKGKKDRRTVLSTKLLQLLRAYFKKEKPSYWLFEGAAGGKYSASSITKIFRRAATDSKINPWATVHTLRHSFGTHLLQAGTNLRHIQHLMGHESSKTTEIYRHVMNVSVDRVMSPLDMNEENDNLQR